MEILKNVFTENWNKENRYLQFYCFRIEIVVPVDAEMDKSFGDL